MSLPEWARAYGDPLFPAEIRTCPEHFVVHEELGFDLDGDGEHDYLHVEKTGSNTEWVARQLAGHASVPVRDIGYAGLKDRHAVTRQWFSVPRRHSPDWQGLDVAGVTLLQQCRHGRKLRRGAHRCNRFRIVLRGSPVGGLDERLARIAAEGVPNYYGEQRFGRDAGNIALAERWAAGKRLSRHKRSLAISSVRSWLFNDYLDGRVRDGTWNRVLDGDTVNLDGSRSIFTVDAVDADIRRRCDAMDLHPAGVLCGTGTPDAGQWQRVFEEARVEQGHRSLRLRVSDLSASVAGDALELEFTLGRGAYATAVLREVAAIIDARRGRRAVPPGRIGV